MKVSKRFYRRATRILAVVMTLAGLASPQVLPDAPSCAREAMGDAWWTGPILANSANTLPRGHWLVEPYVYDVIGPHTHAFGSRAYVEYGLFNRFTVGMIPIVGYTKVGNGTSSSGIQFGDATFSAQYRLTTFREGHWLPTTAINIQQSFPTARYDQLGTRPSDGMGSGTYGTTIALNSQTFFWMPNGRILRMRLDLAETFSSATAVKDVSVYGTTTGFRGHADPGRSQTVDAAWEYSMTRNWVLALDGFYDHSGNTRVLGTQSGKPVSFDSGSSWGYGFAPAVEYNLSGNVGVIFGARVRTPGQNTNFTVAPVMAINVYR